MSHEKPGANKPEVSPRVAGLPKVVISLLSIALLLATAPGYAQERWVRHTIDASSRGADGVRFLDANGDGKVDWAAVPWEEGGVVRLYRKPAADDGAALRRPWPSVTVGEVASPEDAVIVDLSGRGEWAVVSACEGDTKRMYLHRPALRRPTDWLDVSWSVEPLGWSAGVRWMYTTAIEVGGRVELISGAKGDGAYLALWTGDDFPQALRGTGWIMSLIAADMDGDGDEDLLFSDRKGERSGIYWLEQPNAEGATWYEHEVGATGEEVMFIDSGDFDGDGDADIAAAIRPRGFSVFINDPSSGWSEREFLYPEGTGDAKSAAFADVNLDGRTDLVLSCEHADGDKEGVLWVNGEQLQQTHSTAIAYQGIAGPEGVKFDRIAIADVDGDGDPDVSTCEEREGLGVIWYENPTR